MASTRVQSASFPDSGNRQAGILRFSWQRSRTFFREISVWHRTILVIVSWCVLLLAHASPGQACPVVNQYLQLTTNGHSLNAEVAVSHAGHMCGLAFRTELAADNGMLFAYAEDQMVGFWMKNTFIPLSIAFLDGNGKILEMHDMDPREPDRRYISRLPARYALEVNQGWFLDNGINVGDRVEFDSQVTSPIYRYSAH